ncbi:MAG: hypothetical protein H8E55_10055 [Pelagibacterales bacterium]|nr:hypothetical protein [Pelagibacterales bacterium]
MKKKKNKNKKNEFEMNAKDLLTRSENNKQALYKSVITAKERAAYCDQLIFKTKRSKIVSPEKGKSSSTSYKGKEVYFTKFETEIMTGGKVKTGREAEYEGYCSDEGYPHGNGKLTEIGQNYTREGEWEDGQFIKGTYSMPFKTKYVGSFMEGSDGDSHLQGDGVEYHYQSKEDYIKDKPIGYVKGFFVSMGTLLKGEILNPFIINYTEDKFIKKIIYYDEAKPLKEFSHMNNLMRKGKMFYETAPKEVLQKLFPNINVNRPEGQGIEYEGEIFFDQPHGKGTMTFEDGSKRTAVWDNGDTDWN